MKLLPALTVSVLFSLGSLAAVAQTGGMGGEDRESSFSVVDENDDGILDREEASTAGVNDQRFDDMDQNGDGVVSEQEYSDRDESGQRGERDDMNQGQQNDDPGTGDGGGWQ